MNEAQVSKNGSGVRELSEKLWLTNLPTPSEALLANSLQPLFTTLFNLFRTSQRDSKERSLSVRKQVMKSMLSFVRIKKNLLERSQTEIDTHFIVDRFVCVCVFRSLNVEC
jgi:hypothetical protein